MQVCGDGRAIRLGSTQRATPHPALRATFPSKLGKGSARRFETCVNIVDSLLRQPRLAQAFIKAVVIVAQIRSVVWLARLELGDRLGDVERHR